MREQTRPKISGNQDFFFFFFDGAIIMTSPLLPALALFFCYVEIYHTFNWFVVKSICVDNFL